MSRIRVVSPLDGHSEMPFADAARRAVDSALADGALTLLVAWETPKHEVRWIAVPFSRGLARGLTDMLTEHFYPAPAGDAEDE